MKFLLALTMFTSFSAFADLQATLNNMNASNDEIKKALYVEISQGQFHCSGAWTSSSQMSSVLTSSSIKDWKFTYTASNTNPTILAEGKYSGGRLSFKFEVTQDLKKVNAYTYSQWQTTIGEVNVGTLMNPIFEQNEIRSNEQIAFCKR